MMNLKNRAPKKCLMNEGVQKKKSLGERKRGAGEHKKGWGKKKGKTWCSRKTSSTTGSTENGYRG